MRLSEIKNYLLDNVTEYSIETPDRGYYLSFKPGIHLLNISMTGQDNSIYELLKEYEIKHVYIHDNNSFGICLTDKALTTLISLGKICLNSDDIKFTTRYMSHLIDIEDSKESTLDPLDIDLPF